MREDGDNFRTYYRDATRLYCYQEDAPGRFEFYACTPDGEPSHPVIPPVAPIPEGDSKMAARLRLFLGVAA
jgi:hypothetical protein